MYNLLNVALTAGIIMLKNGSETYRVRNTIYQILFSKKIKRKNIDILVVGTGIIATIIPDNDSTPITINKSIDKRVNNLQKISQIANLAKCFSNREISITQAIKKLKVIDNAISYNLLTRTLATCLGTSCFSIAFSGSLFDGFFTFLATIVPAFFINYTRKNDFPFFLSNMIAGALVALFALIFLNTHIVMNINNMIASVIIILTPGVASVTAIRDMVNGDFITGASRGIDALIQAASLALGVGAVFSLWFEIFGGVIWMD